MNQSFLEDGDGTKGYYPLLPFRDRRGMTTATKAQRRRGQSAFLSCFIFSRLFFSPFLSSPSIVISLYGKKQGFETPQLENFVANW